jgi:SAM-dependent methyltransferase
MEPLKKIVTTNHGYKTFEEAPTQEFLNEYYSTMYYQNPQGTYQTEYSQLEQTQRKLRIQLLEIFINENVLDSLNSTKSFLDVGCGEGYVLNHFKNCGWAITGLDFSTHGVRTKNPDVEPFITQGDVYESIEKLTNTGLQFQVIFLGNILEHVLDPVGLVDSLYVLLEKDGLLCITVPNDFSNLQNFLTESGEIPSPYWLAYPDHLNYFSLESLSNLLNERQLPVVDHFADFPIEWFLVNPDSNYALDKTKGKNAHNSRVILDGMINDSKDIAAKQAFWRSLSKLGFGRSFTTISRKG